MTRTTQQGQVAGDTRQGYPSPAEKRKATSRSKSILSSLELGAWHEAGHAVAEYRRGNYIIEGVWVEEDGSGMCGSPHLITTAEIEATSGSTCSRRKPKNFSGTGRLGAPSKE
jgi:hypothetical protein